MLAPQFFNQRPLGQLQLGQHATVAQLVGNQEYIHRMHELGLRDGAIIEMVQPGNPCIVRLENTRLCFRDCDALRVLVTVEE